MLLTAAVAGARSPVAGGYAQVVTDRLVELRRAGETSFEQAFETVLLESPPPGSWTRRYLRGSESAIELLRRTSAAEWAGESTGRWLDLRAALGG